MIKKKSYFISESYFYPNENKTFYIVRTSNILTKSEFVELWEMIHKSELILC